MIGIVLSILFPGLGQIYFGKFKRAILMIILALVPFMYPVALIWSIIDAIKIAKNDPHPEFEKKDVITLLVVFFVVIPIVLYGAWIGTFGIMNLMSKQEIEQTTQKEIEDIKNAISAYMHDNNGKVPYSISALIDGRPLRKAWLFDKWEREYIYEINSDSTDYLFKSKGSDGQINTKDDLVFHKPE